jgi:cholesterol transport system auxiliary component
VKPLIASLRGTCLGTLLVLGGCTILPESEPLKVFQFPATSMQPAGVEEIDASLRINTPQAGFALSGPRMLVNPEGQQLSTYRGSRWSDPTPAVLREHMARSFVLHGGVRTISTDEHSLHADVHLGTDLRRFQVIYLGGPKAVIELDARVIESSSRRVLAYRTFLIEEPLQDEQVPGVVDAFGIAADRLSAQLVPWTLEALRQRAGQAQR